jgi:amidophosphoribosyltransferase
MLAFRDPHGIRPLCFGTRKNPSVRTGGILGEGYAFASESVAIDAMIPSGFSYERDIAPGEAVLATLNGEFFSEQCHTVRAPTPCIFEYVYFARPDSVCPSPLSLLRLFPYALDRF